MKAQLHLPIRWKILVTLLIIVTSVVGIITFTMAQLFHEDKQAYIHDLTATVALGVAEESRSVLDGYQDQLVACARILTDGRLDAEEKRRLIQEFFRDSPDLVAVSLFRSGTEVATAHDSDALAAAGIGASDLADHRAWRSLPLERIAQGGPYLGNSSIASRAPLLTVALAVEPGPYGAAQIVAGLIRPDRLIHVVSRSQVFDVFLADSSGMVAAHPDPGEVARRARASVPPGLEILDLAAGVTRRYERNGVPMIGAFADVEFAGVVAGAEIPQSAAYLASRDLLERLVLAALVLLIVAAITGLAGARGLTRSLERLSHATHAIAQGDFKVHVQVASRDEIGALATSFNHMAAELDEREQALEKAQAQLIQSEKMAAFGQLGAGIAHEVKNPLAGILGCAQLSLRKLEKGTAVYQNLELIEKETKRCKTIVDNLLRFARQEQAVLEPMDVNATVEDAMAIVNHQLELNGVSLSANLEADLHQIRGNTNQLQQVLMNLFINAQQAMEGRPGSITVMTRQIDPASLEIRVGDTGPGVPDASKTKIFEPFFTTKPGGQGTGLGLSVTFGIIKDHRGDIRIEDGPEGGAVFVITLPAMEVDPLKVETERCPT